MSSTAEFRRPAAFHPDDPNVVLRPAPLDIAPRAPLATVAVEAEAVDPAEKAGH